ncbi:MAG TPA: oxidoreductase, partial [Alphaproteobacteria bacterium]|nr:oxidoreductase [Alphaproteobacteria bacterium]
MSEAASPRRLAGRVAVVTGASRGFGAAAAAAIAAEGAHLILVA